MPRYSHQLLLAFTVESEAESGDDITPEQIKDAVYRRFRDCTDNDEWLEACLPPNDTEEIEE